MEGVRGGLETHQGTKMKINNPKEEALKGQISTVNFNTCCILTEIMQQLEHLRTHLYDSEKTSHELLARLCEGTDDITNSK